MAAFQTTVNYTNPVSGSKVVFCDDGTGQLTQGICYVDPANPGIRQPTFADLVRHASETSELLFEIHGLLEKLVGSHSPLRT